MHTLSEDDIDDLCERFEEERCEHSSGADGIIAFMLRNDVAQPADFTLVGNLAEIDIERSWMAWAKRMEAFDSDDKIDSVTQKSVTVSPVSDLVSALKSVVSFKEYENLFTDPAIFASIQSKLARCESRCRDQWGDALGPLYYQHHYGIDVGVNPEFASRRVRIDVDGHRGKSAAVFPLRGCNYFGRRRSFDTSDYCFEETPEGNRIIVAGFRESIISRLHFSVQVLSAAKVMIRNQCPINPLRVMGQEKLTYQQETMVAYPFSIRLPGRTLRFF